MASKSAETYCSIGKYISKVDPKLYELLDDACLVGLLNPGSKTGITFLHPRDAAWRKKFESLIHSNTVGSKPAAEDMVRALIIRDTLKTGRDWMAKRENIPNSLFPFQHVAVKSANDKEVMFESGAKAVTDPNFTDDSRKQNHAVWTLVSGEIPVTTDKPAKSPAGKSGKYEPEAPLANSRRFQIGRLVETEYAQDELNRRASGSHSPSQCYLKYTLSLVNHLLRAGLESVVYGCVLPNISFDKFDFYVLVEPHSASGPYLLDNATIESWWADASSRVFDITALKAKVLQMQSSANQHCNCAVYNSRGGLLDAIHHVRTTILNGRRLESATKIVEAYKHLESSNSIGGSANVFPMEIAAHYQAHAGLKLTQDELRYITYLRFQTLEASPQFDLGAYNYILNYIGDRLHAPNEASRSSLRTIINPAALQYHIKPKEQITEIAFFVNSTMFMFVPQSSAETLSISPKSVVDRPHFGGSNRFFNIQQAIHEAQLRVLPELSGEYHEHVAAWLRTLDPSQLTPASREQLKNMLA
jgi:hypothetical protein